ncbi:hypothetical protein BDN72DRAFT_962322 [Pluteus cervinus]|uniref:Uncharacterized protein n=1 Tax=Pluteus cervinus TaxID=181527 RepID=A0ACD3AJ70_9AGAR|nr:hypothetical protein BDN72DRAFT_962322 [Pluteus cervinus]
MATHRVQNARRILHSLFSKCLPGEQDGLSAHRHGLPDLPAEIWISIIRMATEVPYFLFDDLMEMPSFERHRPFETKYLQDSLTTKLSIVLVCKAWFAWGLPYLYEGITLKTFSSLDTLVRVLSETEESDDIKPLGHFVKRLDTLPSLRSPHVLTAEIWETIGKVIQRLPNLQVFCHLSNLGNIYDVPTRVIEALATTCGRTLEVLAWPNVIGRPTVTDLTGLVLSTPNLRVLYRSYAVADTSQHRRATWFTPPNPSTSTFDSQLTSVYYGRIYHNSPPNDYLTKRFASSPLRHVTFSLTYPILQAALVAHGEKLTYLNLQCAYLDVHNVLTEVMNLIQQNCPKVIQLHLTLSSTTVFSQNLRVPPSVEVLALLPWPAGFKAAWRALFNGFMTMQLGGLKEVLFLNDVLWEQMLRTHLEDLMAVTSFFASKEVAFRGSEGELISDLYL